MVNSSQPKKQSKKPPTTCTFFSHHASTKKHEPSSPAGEVLLDISATLSRVTGALNVPSPSCILFFIPMGHVPLCRLRISALDLLLALGWVGGKKSEQERVMCREDRQRVRVEGVRQDAGGMT